MFSSPVKLNSFCFQVSRVAAYSPPSPCVTTAAWVTPGSRWRPGTASGWRPGARSGRGRRSPCSTTGDTHWPGRTRRREKLYMAWKGYVTLTSAWNQKLIQQRQSGGVDTSLPLSAVTQQCMHAGYIALINFNLKTVSPSFWFSLTSSDISALCWAPTSGGGDCGVSGILTASVRGEQMVTGKITTKCDQTHNPRYMLSEPICLAPKGARSELSKSLCVSVGPSACDILNIFKVSSNSIYTRQPPSCLLVVLINLLYKKSFLLTPCIPGVLTRQSWAPSCPPWRARRVRRGTCCLETPWTATASGPATSATSGEILASDWSIELMWSLYWPLIG